MLRLFNTLTKQKEDFKPIKDGHVGMYNCGPTVYDYVHIGNLRAYVFADILRRTLEWNGYEVKQIVNITDFGHLVSDADTGEDKMMKGLKREGRPITLEAMRELADKYKDAFLKDLAALNIKTPNELPHASDHIPAQIELIKKLEEKGFTYKTSDGVYFDTSKDEHYGKLGGLSDAETQQARVADNPEKKNQRDFALWKLAEDGLGSAPSDPDTLGWDSPWGKGFPGWHVECSAMSMEYLGEHFDVHTGGIDHIPTHHNNEIAQSENATGKQFVNYWLHNAFITLNADPKSKTGASKMAKSAGGFITRGDLEQKGFEPIGYRYWLLTAHYRTPADFSWEALEGAQNAYRKLVDRFLALSKGVGTANQSYIKKFGEHINNDLNTPEALALTWELLKDAAVADEDKKATLLQFDTVLGLGLEHVQPVTVPDEIAQLITEREEARKSEDWKKADKLRKEIEKLGFTLEDTAGGSQVRKR